MSMEISKRTFYLVILCCVLGSAFVTIPLSHYFSRVNLNYYPSVGIDMVTQSIHCRIRMWQSGELVFDEYHAGAVTDLGDNQTLFKLFGDTDMQYVDIPYTDNATYISIGDQGSLTTSSTVLPGEWNRTAGTIDNENQSYLNVSCTFYPDSGPYTADCIGLNFNATASANNLWGYDTFTEVTGIDDTFTINVDFKITSSHS